MNASLANLVFVDFGFFFSYPWLHLMVHFVTSSLSLKLFVTRLATKRWLHAITEFLSACSQPAEENHTTKSSLVFYILVWNET